MPRTKKPQKIQKAKIIPEENLLDKQRILFKEMTLTEMNERKNEILFESEEVMDKINSLIASFTLGLSSETLDQPYEKYLFGNQPDFNNVNEKNLFSKLSQIDTISRNAPIQVEEKNVRVTRSKKNQTFDKPSTSSSSSVPTVSSSTQHFLTPAGNSRGRLNPITPKIEPNAPLTVLRYPRHGEIGISINGSPLLVSTNHAHDLANVNIPLQDGNIISLMGQDGEVDFNNVSIGNKTKEQLKILRRNLNIILEDEEGEF